MTPDGLRDLLRIGISDLVRADELIAGVIRRREYGDLRVLGTVEALNTDPTLTALALARRSVTVATHEMLKTMDMQVGYLRTVEDISAEYLGLHADDPRHLADLVDDADDPRHLADLVDDAGDPPIL